MNKILEYIRGKKNFNKFISDYRRALNDDKILNSNNRTKSAWKILNKQQNKGRGKSNISLKINNSIVNDPKTLAETFATQFNLTHKPLRDCSVQEGRYFPTLFLDPVDPQEIFNILMGLPNKYSSGIDEIPIYVIKFAGKFLAEPLADITNECLSTQVFPEDLKKAKLVPVFKKGDCQNVSNYRPVSLLPAVSKVFERVIYNRLMNHLIRHQILSQNQFGFIPKRSTEMAIYNVITYITEQIDNNRKVAGLYFDLSKAFDTVEHQLLLNILNKYGIRGAAATLIESYMTNRKQTVFISKDGDWCRSSTTKIVQGVPQGSILGPILFLLYVNGLEGELSTAMVFQYADDTSVVIARDTLEALSRDCSGAAESMKLWCEGNHLKLNSNKTGLVTFSKSLERMESVLVWLDGHSIPRVEQIKFLGLNLDSTLNWEKHISSMGSRLSSLCGLVRRLRDTVSIDSIRLLYFGQIQSIINYGIIFWGSSRVAMDIFRMQKSIIRCIFKLHPRTSCRPYFLRFGILTVPSLYFKALVMFVKKNRHYFPTNGSHYAEDMVMLTRHRDDLRIPLHNSSFYERGPYYRALKAFGLLPANIKQMGNDNIFKRSLNQWLSQKCFYDFGFSFS